MHLQPKEVFGRTAIDDLYYLATGGGVTFGGCRRREWRGEKTCYGNSDKPAGQDSTGNAPIQPAD